MTRRLTLRKDTLVELTSGDLESIAAAVDLGKAAKAVWVNCAVGDLVAGHTVQCLAGCTCYCG